MITRSLRVLMAVISVSGAVFITGALFAAATPAWHPVLTCDVGNRFVVDEDQNEPSHVQIVIHNPDAAAYAKSTGAGGTFYDDGRTLVIGPLERRQVFGPPDFFATTVSLDPSSEEAKLSWNGQVSDTYPFGLRFNWRFGGCWSDASLVNPL